MQGAPAGSLAVAAITRTCRAAVSSDPDMSRRHLLRVRRPLALVLPCNPCLAMREDNDVSMPPSTVPGRPSRLARVGRTARGQAGPCRWKCRVPLGLEFIYSFAPSLAGLIPLFGEATSRKRPGLRRTTTQLGWGLGVARGDARWALLVVAGDGGWRRKK
ncbi:uncharacterized protein [Triticum aestivum]|uniref:uncharacterized protein n=1 Tax=Triticum aestivum TaxID=4565 RepID=UPI001D034CBB|nr:uncharacterized protein LOC123095290 [Triticum aestivum]